MQDAPVGVVRSARPAALEGLRLLLVNALGSGIGVACTGIDGDPQALWPVEREAVLNAVPRRQREFAAGRAAAREAMHQIGWPATALPSAPDRSPIWPLGVMGSIAHSRQACVVIAGRRDQTHAMGIDIEEDHDMDPPLWASICTPGELARMEGLSNAEKGQRVTRVFCAKEAYYKWQYPQTQQVLDFCEVEVALSRHGASFRVQPATTTQSKLLSCDNEGHLLAVNGLLVAWQIGPPAAQA